MLTALAALTSSNSAHNGNNATHPPAAAPPPSSTLTTGNILASFSLDTPMMLDDSLPKQSSFQPTPQQNFLGQPLGAGAGPKPAHTISSPAFLNVESVPQTGIQQTMGTVNLTGLGLTQSPSLPTPSPSPPAPMSGVRSGHARKGQTQSGAKVSPRTASPSHTVTPTRSASAPGGLSHSHKKDGFAVPQVGRLCVDLSGRMFTGVKNAHFSEKSKFVEIENHARFSGGKVVKLFREFFVPPFQIFR